MPIKEMTPEETLEFKKAELKMQIEGNVQRDKDRQLKLDMAKIEIQPDLARAKIGRWEMVLNAPARFLAIILAYRLEKKQQGVPEWLQDFILR